MHYSLRLYLKATGEAFTLASLSTTFKQTWKRAQSRWLASLVLYFVLFSFAHAPRCISIRIAVATASLVHELIPSRMLTERKGCSATQLALAWVHAQGDDVFPIPGTKSVQRLLEASRGGS